MRTDLTDFALTKVKAGNGWRPDVGTHQVDFLARIRGTLRVGENYDRTPTASIPLLSTLALFIRRMGVTRDAAEEALVSAMTEALEAGEKGASHIEELPWVKETIERVQGKIVANLPKVSVNGSVTTKLEISDIIDLTAP